MWLLHMRSEGPCWNDISLVEAMNHSELTMCLVLVQLKFEAVSFINTQ